MLVARRQKEGTWESMYISLIHVCLRREICIYRRIVCDCDLTHMYVHICTYTHTHTQSGSSVLPTLTTPHHPRTPHRKPHPPPQAATTVEDIVTEILRVFVDAIPHVPDHRRLPLLSHLLTRVGPAKFLSVALGLLVTKHVQQLGVKEQVSYT